MSQKPDGTEDKAQIRALGEYFARKARGEIKDTPLVKPPGFTWGFTPEERARLEAARAAQTENRQKEPKQGPDTPKP